jgi:hypothetical protein
MLVCVCVCVCIPPPVTSATSLLTPEYHPHIAKRQSLRFRARVPRNVHCTLPTMPTY